MSEIQNIKELIEFIDGKFIQFIGHFDIQSRTVGNGIESIKKEIQILEEKFDETIGRVIGVEKDVCRHSDEIKRFSESERIKFDHVWDELRQMRKGREEIIEKEKRELSEYVKAYVKGEILSLKVWLLIQGFAFIVIAVGWLVSFFKYK